ncbi:MAG: AAA family ATPase, partial [Psychromonas sp.]
QLCKRPVIITGGELTLDMLEVRFDQNSKLYQAPLQLKANNGILLLDDLGRQKVSPKALFNRWIVPLEERRDFLSLQSGQHFETPFELLLLFSTNLSPNDLIDDAFLRRLGYKIPFAGFNKEEFKHIWDLECDAKGLSCEPETFDYLSDNLLTLHNKDFLPCYPRDLISIIDDQIVFNKLPANINKELLNFAWHSYFV